MSKQYVAYHNVEKMGRALREGDPCRVISNRSLKSLETCVVWMVVGEKVIGLTKKRFSIGSVFTVSEFGDLADDEFKYYASGAGKSFDPPILISNEPWFEEFRKNARSFEGIHPIKDPAHVAALEALAGHAS